jgi:hypothetical protein
VCAKRSIVLERWGSSPNKATHLTFLARSEQSWVPPFTHSQLSVCTTCGNHPLSQDPSIHPPIHPSALGLLSFTGATGIMMEMAGHGTADTVDRSPTSRYNPFTCSRGVFATCRSLVKVTRTCFDTSDRHFVTSVGQDRSQFTTGFC